MPVWGVSQEYTVFCLQSFILHSLVKACSFRSLDPKVPVISKSGWMIRQKDGLILCGIFIKMKSLQTAWILSSSPSMDIEQTWQ